MNWMLIMVVTALYPIFEDGKGGGTRSVDVTMERFSTKAECVSMAQNAYNLVKKHQRSHSAMEYKCVRASKLGEEVADEW